MLYARCNFIYHTWKKKNLNYKANWNRNKIILRKLKAKNENEK